MRRSFAATVIVLVSLSRAGFASADPLRLRGDAYAQTPSPTGLLVLQGEDAQKPYVSAEALAWLGSGREKTSDVVTGDVLALTVRLHDPSGRAELKAGRFLESAGSVRPIHLDGASALYRAPWGTSVEAFGGAPVVPRFGDRAYDWAAGGRVAQTVAERAVIGVALVHQNDHGRVSDEEVGADLAAAPARWLDVAARAAYDLESPGISDALASIGSRLGDVRLEAFGNRRSPSRLLPATSLFSVLGDVPSTRAGGTIKWFAAPRLDLFASGAAELIDDRAGADLLARATLRTDDAGRGSLGLELRRQAVPGALWSGARAIATAPIGSSLRAATELELAHADHPDGRGDLWPWALVALTWRTSKTWDVAAAMEAASTSTAKAELTALVRASFAWEHVGEPR